MVWRLILLVIPVIALVLWVRHIRAVAQSEDTLEDDLAKLKRRLLGLLVAFAAILIVWYNLVDSGPAGDCYIPDRVVDGQIIPGEFVAFDDPRCAADAARRAAKGAKAKDSSDQPS